MKVSVVPMCLVWFVLVWPVAFQHAPAADQPGESERTFVVGVKRPADWEAKSRLAPELVATKQSGGTLVGMTAKGQPIVKVPNVQAAQKLVASPMFISLSADVPKEYQKVQRLRISYKPGSKPTAEKLKEMGLRLVEDYEKGSFLIVEPEKAVTAALATRLEREPGFEYVKSVYKVQVIEPPPKKQVPRVPAPRRLTDGVSPLQTASNDPLLPLLWGMESIRAPQAWKKVTETPVIVAVIDTGVATGHSDFCTSRVNIWTNPKDSTKDGVDDDGNGIVDDVHGADFENGDGDPADDYGHGTHCAGTVGAVGNNSLGVAGVNWGVQIMALKWLDEFGGGQVENAVKCIDYAVDHGAKVLSNSWYWPGGDPELEEAIGRAEQAGVLFVAAAANFSEDNDDPASVGRYPSSYEFENILSVLAINDQEGLSSFSSFGKLAADLGAPGGEGPPYDDEDDIYSTIPPDDYGYSAGTSMATPHVAGAAALVWGHPAYSGATWQEVKQLLLDHARPLPALKDKCVTGGTLDIGFLVNEGPDNGGSGGSLEKALRDATWTVWVTWDNGVEGEFQITFNSDGTFVTGSYKGRWFQVGRRAVWALEKVPGLPDWSVTYTADLNDTGTGFSGIQGWSHTSGKPKGVHSGVRAALQTQAAQLRGSPATILGRP